MKPTQFDAAIPSLYTFLRSHCHRMQSHHDDIVQEVILDILKYLQTHPAFMPYSWEAYLCGVLKTVIIRYLKKEERIWLHNPGDESAVVTDRRDGPDTIFAEVERRERQSLLLSDILREFASHCEEKRGMHVHKEIYERRWCAQTPRIIANEMGLTEDNVNKHLDRAREWLIKRIQQADVSKSVFQTFLRDRRDVPSSGSLPPGVPANFNEVMERLVREAGVLCPSEARLNLYLGRPTDRELSDVRFHIEGTQCPFCLARSGRFTED